MRHPLTLLTAAVGLTGCVTPQQNNYLPPAFTVSSEFNAAQARALNADGVNVVRGNAFMRQRGGGVVTCAGATVSLIPATAYATERIRIMYGTFAESTSARLQAQPTFNPDPPEFRANLKTTRCDAQGNFVFDRVADGKFYVQVTVAWTVGNRPQGGSLISRVRVAGGEHRSVVMAD